ncbi:MAG: polyprenol monophosphomannose synthase [Desulfobacca sp.]|nr:polyprenol monophosphomannose synthase [Desulfobacca sp.]
MWWITSRPPWPFDSEIKVDVFQQPVSVSVVLPTYNEAGNIGPLIEVLLSHLPVESEVVVVDDDSPDLTWQVVETLAKKDSRIQLIRRIGRRGLTSALQEGIGSSQGKVVFWMDCDFSQPPEMIAELLQALDDYDIVVASRYVPGGEEKGHSQLGSFLSKMICRFASWVLSPAIKDYTSGYVGTRKEILQALPLEGDYGEYCIGFLFRAYQRGYRILEIPYTCLPRRSGESKTATDLRGYLKRGSKYILTVLKLRFRG